LVHDACAIAWSKTTASFANGEQLGRGVALVAVDLRVVRAQRVDEVHDRDRRRLGRRRERRRAQYARVGLPSFS
jgi:hypothetical protein